MPDAPSIPPAVPPIRFSVRTMLASTAVAAIVAAVAAFFWRQQPPAVRLDLAVYWGSLLVCLVPVGWYSHREVSRQRLELGAVCFALKPTNRSRLSPLADRSQFVRVAAIVLPLVSFVFLHSHTISIQSARPNALMRGLFMALFLGFATSFMFAIPVQAMLRKWIYLCPSGVSAGGGIVPWSYIRHAEWLGDRQGAMKLRRLDGDFCFDVPENIRDEVEAFVRSKTAFVRDAQL